MRGAKKRFEGDLGAWLTWGKGEGEGGGGGGEGAGVGKGIW